MTRRPPRSTRTYTRFPYTTLFRSIAVVGSGIAGLTAAYALSKHSSVTLYEADSRLGGHADTHYVDGPDGPVGVDTGFIVRSEEHTSELQSLMRISYAVVCLKKKYKR